MKRFLALALALASCGPSPPPQPPGPPAVALHLDDACALAPAAGLAWIVDARPRTIAETADLIPAMNTVIPEERFKAFSEGHGGIDLRQVQQLCVAGYATSTLAVVRSPFDAARIERTFTDRVTKDFARAVDVVNPPVVRMWGDVGGESQQLVLFGRDALAFEDGKGAAARVAEAFALGKLKRAAPALHGAALEGAAQRLGDAPVRLFAPGPFEGATAQGLGGLLRATTAIAASARFAGPPARIAVRLVLMGAWGDDASAAGERLSAAVHVVSESSLGRLLGLNAPLEPVQVRISPDVLVVETVLDGALLARGLHDALDAEVGEILRR
ncbi:MAG TPA: hypothetical protein VIF62_22040 [Labilithrix sp.]